MLGEMSQSGIHWMEPRDLKTDDMSFKINDRTRPSFRSMHTGVVNMLFCDGGVRTVKDDVDPKVLKAAITISGGEPPGNFDN
jgi:prepilin-type processing-associated H-X9-DG protein